jgi:hypothetical protein
LSTARIARHLIDISITTTAKSVLNSNASCATTLSRYINDSEKNRIRRNIIALTAAMLFTGGNKRTKLPPTNAVIGNVPAEQEISKNLTTLKK